MTKRLSPVTDVVFVVMDALENVFEALILHCHEKGDCQERDDRHSERSRVGSEALHSVDDFQSERSRVSSELHCCQDEDVQVIGWCHDPDDVFQLAQLRPSSFLLISCFLASSNLDLHFSTNSHEDRKVPGHTCWS